MFKCVPQLHLYLLRLMLRTFSLFQSSLVLVRGALAWLSNNSSYNGPRNLDAIVLLSSCFMWGMCVCVHVCTAKIIASLNILFTGVMPDIPLEQHIADLAFTPMRGDFKPPYNPCNCKTPVRCSLVEVRGDWKFIRELFNLGVGWNSRELCHHCHVSKESYLQFPPALDRQPRRDLASFLSTTRLINDPSY